MPSNIKEEQEKLKRITVEIPEPLHRILKIQAVIENKSVKGLIAGLIRGYMQGKRFAVTDDGKDLLNVNESN